MNSIAKKTIKRIIQGRKSTLFKQDKSPFWNLRMMHQGRRRLFSTGETTTDLAISKAAAILADLKSRGWEETVALHSRRVDRIPTDPTVHEFADLFRDAVLSLDAPPSFRTREFYLKCLSQIAKTVGVSRIRSLSGGMIDEFKATYQAAALAQGRTLNSIKTSINSLLRNAAALFSESLLAEYKKRGIELANPFKGKLVRVQILEFTPLKPEIVRSIWQNAILLRDGDPAALAPEEAPKHWEEPDWRKPYPEAYLLLLLEFCLGLRRNEADKAEWSWIHPEFKDGQIIGQVMQVQETAYFQSKSGHKRSIWMPGRLFEELQRHRHGDSQFIIPGRVPKAYAPMEAPKNIPYRCDLAHRVLTHWLRRHGIVGAKPCHALRKQFGSMVATQFGLYQAQKLLGHSSPTVTSAYYANLVDLPKTDFFESKP